jgi:glycine/D-amino acid oxidase-like deaminating enzyme
VRRWRDEPLEVPPVGARSYWLSQALRADAGQPCPALRGTTEADVCVVGGGFAGLWTAYELLEREPALDVVLLEADICGAGGSGANGGCFSNSWHMVDSLCRLFGEDEGMRYARVLADQVAELAAWCERHDAHIDFHREGNLFARAEEWQPGPSEGSLAVAAKHGLSERWRAVDAEEAPSPPTSPPCSRPSSRASCAA